MNLADQITSIFKEDYKLKKVGGEVRPSLYVVTDIHDGQSVAGTRGVVNSAIDHSSFDNVFLYPQTHTHSAEHDLQNIKNIEASVLQWTWPLKEEDGDQFDKETGLVKRYLSNHKQNKLIFQTITHIRLWDLCVNMDKPIVVCNSNIRFNQGICWSDVLNNYDSVDETNVFRNGVIGLNVKNAETYNNKYLDLRLEDIHANDGQTRMYKSMSLTFDEDSVNEIQPFAGHGCYYITPWAAKEALNVIKRVGMWPIQFLLGRQLCPWTYIIWPQLAYTRDTYSTVWRPTPK